MIPYLITGGSGRLGRKLRSELHGVAPPHNELDITDPRSVWEAVEKYQPHTIIHCAAYTSPPKCEASPIQSLDVNIGGTLNITRECLIRNIRLVYISTEYVFEGTMGEYVETDPVLPQNKYAWSKLAGEAIVRHLSDYLIIRCAFTDRPFPHLQAPVDQFSSRVSTDELVSMLLPLLPKAQGVFHLGTDRRSVYDYAVSIGASRRNAPARTSDFQFPLMRLWTYPSIGDL